MPTAVRSKRRCSSSTRVVAFEFPFTERGTDRIPSGMTKQSVPVASLHKLAAHGRSLADKSSLSLLAGLLFACSPSPAADPSAASAAPPPDEAERTEAETAEAPSTEVPGPNCDDGTCFSCGDGLCPRGAYCDQSAPGGAACAWIQECPGEPSCPCLTKVLGSSCSCEQAPSGPFVTCR